jgi:hypothetical protein
MVAMVEEIMDYYSLCKCKVIADMEYVDLDCPFHGLGSKYEFSEEELKRIELTVRSLHGNSSKEI